MNYTNEERHEIHRLAQEIIKKFVINDRSGRLLYLLMHQLSGLSRLTGFKGEGKYRFYVVSEEEYNKIKSKQIEEFFNKENDNLSWLKDIRI